MASPPFQGLIAQPNTALAIIASGQNPDGSAYVPQPPATLPAPSPGSQTVTFAINRVAPTTGTSTFAQYNQAFTFRNAFFVFSISNAGVGGTSLQWIIQGSPDGVNWIDIASPDTCVPADPTTTLFPVWFGAYATPGQPPVKSAQGTMAARTVIPGNMGANIRIFEKATGTYTTAVTYSAVALLQA